MKFLVLIYASLLVGAVAFRPASLIVNHHKISAAAAAAHRPPLFMTENVGGDDKKKEEKCPIPLPNPANWTPKRIWNSNIFRAGAIVLALVASRGNQVASSISKVSTKLGATIHLLAFGTWLGTVVYTTFVAGFTMYKNLPRQTFGKLQSKLFPKYFQLCSLMLVLQILTLPKALGAQALIVSLAMTAVNQFYLEPKSSKIMFDRYELEDVPGAKESDSYKELASDFGKFHGISSLTNLVALCGAIVHGSSLAGLMVV